MFWRAPHFGLRAHSSDPLGRPSPSELAPHHVAPGFSSLLEADREGGRSGSDVELPGISPQSARELGGRRRRGFMAAIFASAACGALALAASSQSHPDGLRFAGGAFAAFAAAGAANASVVANVSATASVSAISQASRFACGSGSELVECCRRVRRRGGREAGVTRQVGSHSIFLSAPSVALSGPCQRLHPRSGPCALGPQESSPSRRLVEVAPILVSIRVVNGLFGIGKTILVTESDENRYNLRSAAW